MKFVALALVQSLLVSSFALPMQSSSAEPESIVLKSISHGQDLLVQLKTGKNIKGKLESATGSNLELLVKGSRVSIEFTNVLRVYRLKGNHIVKGTLIGAAVGTGSGAAIGAIIYRDSGWLDFGRGFDAAVGGGLGLVIGTVTGLTMGAFWHKKELVYEAPPAR